MRAATASVDVKPGNVNYEYCLVFKVAGVVMLDIAIRVMFESRPYGFDGKLATHGTGLYIQPRLTASRD